MKFLEFVKSFSFSSSYSDGEKICAANYRFEIAVKYPFEASEEKLAQIIQKEIISKVHTRHLDECVDLFQGMRIDEYAILNVFWEKLSRPLSGFVVRRLTLHRDTTTSLSFYPGASS